MADIPRRTWRGLIPPSTIPRGRWRGRHVAVQPVVRDDDAGFHRIFLGCLPERDVSSDLALRFLTYQAEIGDAMRFP